MRSASLDSLPVEILYYICEDVDKNATLRSLLLVCKKIHSVVLSYAYRDVRFRCESPAELAREVQNLRRVAQYVRHLTVQGMRYSELVPYPTHQFVTGTRSFWRGVQPQNRPAELKFNKQTFNEERPGRVFAGEDQFKLLQNAPFRPLADALKEVPVLLDFVWHISEQLPPCILDVLHSHHPDCRLHLSDFHLPSLVGHTEIDAYEYRIATSPCLYSISACLMNERGLQADYNVEAVWDIIQNGLAPNLRKVWLSAVESTRRRRHSIPRKKWPGLKHLVAEKSSSDVAPNTVQLLKVPVRGYLEFFMSNYANHKLPNWYHLIDTSKLRVLELHIPLELADLVYISNNCKFNAVETLAIQLNGMGQRNDPRAIYTPEYDNAAVYFLSKFPSLVSLMISGHITEAVIDYVLDQKGRQLKKLHIIQVNFQPMCFGQLDLSKEHKKRMKDWCPELKSLVVKKVQWTSDWSRADDI